MSDGVTWDASGVALQRDGKTRNFTHAEFAALNDYDAVMLGLPRVVEATLVVSITGRIDHPAFSVEARFEPLTHQHAWAVYHREGARIVVGERQGRLNTHQYTLLQTLDQFHAAGDDIAMRLRRWPALAAALHAPNHARVVVQGAIPHVSIACAAAFPPYAMTRVGAKLYPVAQVDHAQWAMLPHRKYFLPADK